jgi:hypothetical protein
MKRDEIVQFLSRYKLAVQASVAPGGAPQAAVVAFAVSDRLEIIFDTVETTRKLQNLRANPRIAMVVGWEHEMTAQIEGVVDFPTGDELRRVRDLYLSVHADGRDRLAWPGITHVRLRPSWIRLSDFNVAPPRIVEIAPLELAHRDSIVPAVSTLPSHR